MPFPTPPFSSRPIRTVHGVTWRVWAPRAEKVELVLSSRDGEKRHLMTSTGEGYFTFTGHAGPGQGYGYALNGGPLRPDPCSLFQPDGVHRASALFFPEDFASQESSPVIDREDLILYELHVGTFTPDGTFASAMTRLDDLLDLGINAIEIMPVAQCPGTRNWGYDGVHPYATQNTYGGPEGFQRFIDAAHRRGLLVFLDVVFNHLGPEGNYLQEFGPYFTNRHPTPWGDGFNFDGKDSLPVRHWVLDCVWHWIHDFRLDGLRLDAVHAMQDDSEIHLLTEIKRTADEAAAARGGRAIIIAESLTNDPLMVTSIESGGLGLDAEWNEDFHHAVCASMARETHGKYADYQGLHAIRNVFSGNLHLTGQHSLFYGKTWGKRADHVPGDRYVISLQNHDHVGNRATGDRLATQVDEARLRLGACLTLLSPFLPMLFMGEEYGETAPFLFFCDFSDERVIEGVRQGRKRDYALRGTIPDPLDESSFLKSQLSWQWQDDSSRSSLRQLYQSLIQLRRRESALREYQTRVVTLNTDPGREALQVTRGKAGELVCHFNLSDTAQPLPGETPLWRSGEGGESMGPYETVVFRAGSGSLTAPAPDA